MSLVGERGADRRATVLLCYRYIAVYDIRKLSRGDVSLPVAAQASIQVNLSGYELTDCDSAVGELLHWSVYMQTPHQLLLLLNRRSALYWLL